MYYPNVFSTNKEHKFPGNFEASTSEILENLKCIVYVYYQDNTLSNIQNNLNYFTIQEACCICFW